MTLFEGDGLAGDCLADGRRLADGPPAGIISYLEISALITYTYILSLITSSFGYFNLTGFDSWSSVGVLGIGSNWSIFLFDRYLINL